MDVIIVSHTEFGYVKNNHVIYDKNAISGVNLGVPSLIRVVNKYNAKITFAVMPEVAKFFPNDTDHEIGLHIHPGWHEVSMYGETYNIGDSYLREKCNFKSFDDKITLRDCSYEEQLQLIESGAAYLYDVFKTKPKTFVAGRWSINNGTIKALIKAGFTHDCSAVPYKKPCHFDWSKLQRITLPYNPNNTDYQIKGDLPILVLPISQSYLFGSVNPEIIPVCGISWLKAAFLEYYNQQIPLFHICLHSPCMMDKRFVSYMDDLLNFISKFDVNFKFASEIKGYPDQRTHTNLLPYLLGLNSNVLLSGLGYSINKIMKRIS